MKILILASALVITFSSCTILSNREPSQSAPGITVWGGIVKSSKAGAKFCPEAKKGEPCLMNWADAVKFCESQGAHLPTAREWVKLLVPSGIEVLEKNEVEGDPPAPPKGFYLVDSLNPDGSLDAFYMSHRAYNGSLGGEQLVWTSSIPPAHPQYAHVFYEKWGGGGGDPKDHLLTHKNAVRCVQN